MQTEPVDIAARERALDPQHSFCVQAPAGSGKTELLTQRILALLAHCERPEEILAITFTRKAAAEMRHRLLGSLEEAAALDPGALAGLPSHKRKTMGLAHKALAQDARCGWQLLQNPGRLRISTIDSFTNWLGGRLPIHAGFGAAPRISTEMDEVFRRAVRETLAALEDGGHGAEGVEGLLRHLHNDLGRAEALLLALLKQRDQWLPLLAPLRRGLADARQALEDGLRLMVQESLEEANFRLSRFEPDMMALAQHAARNGREALARHEPGPRFPPVRAEHCEVWSEVARLFLKSKYEDFLNKPNRNHGFPAPSTTKDKSLAAHYGEMLGLFTATVTELRGAGLLPLLQRLAQLPPPCYGDAQWQVLEHCITLLPLLVARLDLAMRQEGVVDHVQTGLAALRALGTEDAPTDLALRLDYRLRHILIDEFQDTSIMQFELLKRLTAGWTPGDGRTLFIVGDGMQSCYRFRNADVALFMRAREQVGSLPMELLQLSVNFRSARPVVDWVNTVFAQAFPEQDDPARGGVRFSSGVALDREDPRAGVFTRLYPRDRKKGEEKSPQKDSDSQVLRRIQAADVAELCQRLIKDHPGDSIAILVRSRSSLDALVPALREAGLRWNAEDIDPLLAHMPVRDLFTLLCAVENTADITAWFALLRSPLAGLRLADLDLLASLQQAADCSLFDCLQQHQAHPGLSAEARQILARILPPLIAARHLRQTLPLAELLQNLWIELGGPATLDKPGLLPTIERFFHLVDEAAPQGYVVDMQALEEKLSKARSSERDEGVPLQIMTIHKSKGLEFDHVILPDLDRRPRQDDDPLILWQDFLDRNQVSRPLLALMTARGEERDPLYTFLKREGTARARYETTRLMYIGVTRAIRSAWLFGSVTRNGEECSAGKDSLLATILPALLSAASADAIALEWREAAAGITPSAPGAQPTDSSTLLRLPPDWRSPLPATLLPLPEAAEKPDVTHDPRAAAIGALLHQCLQDLVARGRRYDPARTPPGWRARLRPFFQHAEGRDEALEEALATVHAQLQRCLQGPDAGWLFHTPHRQDACELELCDGSTPACHRHVVDRTFIAEDGRRWIIDYKTGAPAAGQTEADFLAEQEARYRPQLQRYARLLHEPGAADSVLALYFTSLARLHRLN